MTLEVEEARRLDLQPGDVVVCRLSASVSQAAMDRTGAVLNEAFPGHKVIVLADGATLEAVRPAR